MLVPDPGNLPRARTSKTLKQFAGLPLTAAQANASN
jgi:hypothetical protein